MPLRLDHHCDVLPDEVSRLLLDLYNEDNRTTGSPLVKEQDLPLGREWLQRVLIDTLLRMTHVAELCRLYGGMFRRPRLRRDWPEAGRPTGPPPDPAFRHRDLFPESRAEAMIESGVNSLPPDDLARLLLNPVALWDIADLIDTRLPEVWMEPMAERVREMRETNSQG